MNSKDVIAESRFSTDKMRKTNLFETRNFFCDVYGLEPGQEQKVHSHNDADKIFFVVDGSGEFFIGEETQDLGPNQIVLAPAGESHGVRNIGEARLTLLVFMTPNPNKG